MSSNKHHLIVNLLIDNSVLVNELNLSDKIKQLFDELEKVSDECLKLSIHTYDTFTPKRLKGFDDSDIENIEFDGFPLINELIKSSVDYTQQYLIEKNKDEAFNIFRPWLIILSSGIGYDQLDFFEKFQSANKEWQPVLFPFLMTKKYLSYELSKVNQIKPFMVVKDFDFEGFENWLKQMIKTRLSTPADQNMTLDKNMFVGWTEL